MKRGKIWLHSLLLSLCLSVFSGFVGAFSGVFASQTPFGSVWPHDAHIEIAQLEEGRWRVSYRLSRPVARLNLGASLGGFRREDWQITGREADFVSLQTRGGRDYLQAADGARFDALNVIVTARLRGFAKNYEPIRPMGKDGALIYTGHFWPYREAGGRINAVFFISPRAGLDAVAFGRRAPAFKAWRSPHNHPAFVYVGPLAPVIYGGAAMVMDPAMPLWAQDEMRKIAPPILAALEGAFERPLNVTPNIFISFTSGGPAGLVRYRGDALPGQFQLAFYGGKWRMKSPLGQEMLRRALAHEAVHLWQSSTTPAHSGVPGWIHEGAADAIAAEILVQIGIWSQSDKRQDFEQAQRECARTLDGGSLNSAEQRGAVRALYACGHILTVLAARLHSEDGAAMDFWRAFAQRARAMGGYDDALFFQMAAEAGGENIAREMARFARTPFSRPGSELAALMMRVEAARAQITNRPDEARP